MLSNNALYEDRPPTFATLPVDVLREIFDKLLQSHSPDLGARTYCQLGGPGHIRCYHDSILSPLTLCHINSYIRHVVLRTTSLWGSIYIYNIGLRHLPFLQFWLDKAGSRPLTIDLEIPYSRKDVAGIIETASMLITRSAQWRSITFVLPTSAQRDFDAVFPAQISFDALESVVLRLVDWDPTTRQRLTKCLVSSPSLRQINWLDTFGSDIPHSIPWNQLLDLILLYPVEEKKLFDILTKSTELRQLRLGAVYSYPPLLPRSLAVSVQSLTIAATSALETLLSQVKFPHLTELHIENVQWHPSRGGWNMIKSLLYGPGHVYLSHFTYTSRLGNGGAMAEKEILHLLSLPGMDRLRHLEIGLDMTEQIVLMLTHSQHGGGESACRLPLLESISLGRCFLHDGLLSAMIHSRTDKEHSSVRCIKARVRESWDFPQDQETFKAIQKRGIIAELLVEKVQP